jgi:hypothetical protein
MQQCRLWPAHEQLPKSVSSKVFFFEKKKQKTFFRLAAATRAEVMLHDEQWQRFGA